MHKYTLPVQFRHWCEITNLTPTISSKNKTRWYHLSDTHGNTYQIKYLLNGTHILTAVAQTGQVTKHILPRNLNDFIICINNLKILSII